MLGLRVEIPAIHLALGNHVITSWALPHEGMGDLHSPTIRFTMGHAWGSQGFNFIQGATRFLLADKVELGGSCVTPQHARDLHIYTLGMFKRLSLMVSLSG